MTDTLSITVDFEEIERFAKDLGAAPAAIAGEMRSTMQASLDTIEGAVVPRTPVNTGALRGSIGTAIHGAPPRFWGEVVTPLAYGLPVEVGRAPKKKAPPVAAIEYWVIRKGIASGAEAHRAAFAIARHIGKFGRKGVFMFKEGLDETRPIVLKLWDELPRRLVGRLG